MKLMIALVLSVVFLLSILLDQAGRAMPTKELRRRARSRKDKRAANIYKMSAYGSSLVILLWVIGGAAVAALFLMVAAINTWLAVAVVFIASWLFSFSQPMANFNGLPWKLAANLAPFISWVLARLHPVLGRLKLPKTKAHSGVYEKEDLLELLQGQTEQSGNRVEEHELKLAHGALTLAAKKVSDIMLPAESIKFVEAREPIGPMLMDELHQSGNNYFPVVQSLKSSQPLIIGTLYLKDAIGHSSAGTVRSVMRSEVNYISEEQNLHEALEDFVKNQNHAAIVMNNFNEISGLLSLESLLEQVLGRPVRQTEETQPQIEAAEEKLETTEPELTDTEVPTEEEKT